MFQWWHRKDQRPTEHVLPKSTSDRITAAESAMSASSRIDTELNGLLSRLSNPLLLAMEREIDDVPRLR